MGWGELLKVAGLLVLLWLCWRVLVTWLKVRAGKPDFVIGDDYLRRWWVLPRNPAFNIYLHNIRHDDEDRALHDHPWWNCSIILKGCYLEIRPAGRLPALRKAGSMVLRQPTDQHRLRLIGGVHAWTLFITGPKVREWGFWCPQGFVHWLDFVDPADIGSVGRGCGEQELGSNASVLLKLAREKAAQELSPRPWPDAVEFHGDR